MEINLEYNQLTEIPWLGFTYNEGVTDAVINVKNNNISVVDLAGACIALECGHWYLRVVDFENNKIREFTPEMIDYNWDTEIFNFDNNKVIHISSFTISDPDYAYYKVREMYFNNNEIISIDSAAFDKFYKLEILQLSNNKIAIFPFDHIFDTNKLPLLTSVLLNNNNITGVSDETSRFPRGTGLQMAIDVRGMNFGNRKVNLFKSLWAHSIV